MRRQIVQATGAVAVALAALVGGNIAGLGSAAQAAPLESVTAQYGDYGYGTVQTYGGPGYAHGYGESYNGYAASPVTGPFAPSTPPDAVYAPPQYYRQAHPGYPYGCPGVFPC